LNKGLAPLGKAWSLNLAIAFGKGFEEKACLSAITSCCFPKKKVSHFFATKVNPPNNTWVSE